MAWTFPAGNVIWKPEDITALVCQPGCMTPDDWRAVTVVAVLLGESSGNPLARGPVIWAPGSKIHLSIAFGLCQLLSYWHVERGPYPDVGKMTIAQCFTPQPAWARMWLVMNRDRPDHWKYNLTPWSAYTKGSYKECAPAALAGMKIYRSKMGLGPGPFG